MTTVPKSQHEVRQRPEEILKKRAPFVVEKRLSHDTVYSLGEEFKERWGQYYRAEIEEKWKSVLAGRKTTEPVGVAETSPTSQTEANPPDIINLTGVEIKDQLSAASIEDKVARSRE